MKLNTLRFGQSLWALLGSCLVLLTGVVLAQQREHSREASGSGRSETVVWEVATFEADITIPLGHACMGGGVAEAQKILDPLWAKGFVLRPAGISRKGSEPLAPLPAGRAAWFPIVVVALDWCQCNNDSNDRWRVALAEAAGTTRERVLLATVHQHDAPIFDLRAQQLLDQVGKKGWHCDPQFHETAVQRVVQALRRSLEKPRRITHVGLGQAQVERIASNRRVVSPEGRISWNRGSRSGDLYGAPEGEIDPWLKTISFWQGDTPILAWSCYAVHPMSYYGKGQVSADFPGLARTRWQQDDPRVFSLYFTGCAGDVTAGKYNTGTPEDRRALADRLYQALVTAWKNTQRFSLHSVELRTAPLFLPPRDGGKFTVAQMQRILADEQASRWQRISAALGLSWRERVAAGRPIDVPCLDLNGGQALFVVLPGEAFVGYQLAAQKLRPDSFVMVAGFGDGAPGYIPTDRCWKEGYNDDYCWVAPMTDLPILHVLRQVLKVPARNASVIPPPLLAEQTAANSPIPHIHREVIHQELHPQYQWFHPRAAAIPPAGPRTLPTVIMTLQKHLVVSDYYSGLYVLRSDDLGQTWKGPTAIAELDWVRQADGAVLAMCDVTPGYHPPTGKLLALGCSVYYDAQGRQLQDRPRCSQVAYAVYDPPTDRWSPWQILELPAQEQFQFLARNGCGQWLVATDGSLLVPIYFAPRANVPFKVTVLRCHCDGRKITYREHGDELELQEVRGLSEPSLIHCGGMYYLTLRNDRRGYVTRSKDGLHWEPIRPWTFDDGSDLGSYNTQQHWVSWKDELYLVYTRRGAQNDHIPRHRAPLWIARVDRDKLQVLRNTEQVVLPERGAMMGNFGAAEIHPHEWWITVGENLLPQRTAQRTRPDPRGADGSVLLARLIWPRK
jgi:hypothetical protein